MKSPNTPTGGNDKINSILEQWNELSEKEQSELLKTLQQNKKEKGKKQEENTDAILKDLKENHVKIEENAEMMGYKGKKVHIDLPAVGKFEGYKFEFFVSNNTLRRDSFENNPEIAKKSFSINDISKLLKAMNYYMIELKGNNDGNMDYENELKYWETGKCSCNAGYYINKIAGLDCRYHWLKDKNLEGREGKLCGWRCSSQFCEFGTTGYHAGDFGGACLLLKLSD